MLEPRTPRATFTVTSTAGIAAPASNPTPGSLRWAVEQAEAGEGVAVIPADGNGGALDQTGGFTLHR